MSKAEAWVGTWRPHKPRGPIAALYGSPGPKYALPGLTGIAKMAIKPFFHNQHHYYHYYNWLTLSVLVFFHKGITKHDPTKYKAPMFSFGARHTHESESSPGPSYLIPSNITRVGRDGAPAFSLYSRPREPQLFQAPGPGQQTPYTSKQILSKHYAAFDVMHTMVIWVYLSAVSFYNFLWCSR